MRDGNVASQTRLSVESRGVGFRRRVTHLNGPRTASRAGLWRCWRYTLAYIDGIQAYEVSRGAWKASVGVNSATQSLTVVLGKRAPWERCELDACSSRRYDYVSIALVY